MESKQPAFRPTPSLCLILSPRPPQVQLRLVPGAVHPDDALDEALPGPRHRARPPDAGAGKEEGARRLRRIGHVLLLTEDIRQARVRVAQGSHS